MTVPEVPEVVQVQHPDWCTGRGACANHTAEMGVVAGQRASVAVDLWQAVGGRPFVELTTGRADLDMSIFLAARQADRLGRRLIEAAAILMEADRGR